MAAIVWTDVTGFASGLTGVSAGAQTDILAFVNTRLNVTKLGGAQGEASQTLRMARIFLAAHFGEIEQRKGGAQGVPGPVTSETISPTEVKIDYNDAKVLLAPEILRSTVYGAQYLALVKASPARLPFVAS